MKRTISLTSAAILAMLAVGPSRAEEAKPAEAGTPPPAAAPAKDGAAAAPAAGAVGGGWSAEVAPSGSAGITLDEKQSALVKRIADYFNALDTLKGAFVQTTSDNKRMKGKFYIKRPGRFRFDYALPSKQVIVSDGEYLAIQDLDLNNEDRVELDQTPFRILLRKDVDLVRDAKIMEVQEAEDLVVLTMQDKSPDTPGRIRLFLAAKPELELKEWVSYDAQGVATRVEIAEVKKGESLDAELFKIQPVGLNKFHPQ